MGFMQVSIAIMHCSDRVRIFVKTYAMDGNMYVKTWYRFPYVSIYSYI